jgi:hypothetical protein
MPILQKMKKLLQYTYYVAFVFLLTFFSNWSSGQGNIDLSDIRFYEKKERNWGTQLQFSKEREELLTDVNSQYEELSTSELKLTFQNRYWNFLDYKQEQLEIDFEVGPMYGNGLWNDSNYIAKRVADQTVFGIRLNGDIKYLYRFYYSENSFTLVQIDSWMRYDLFQKKSNGTSTDSMGVVTNFENKTDRTKLRYGFSARAGWGTGRLNPVNHIMIADYLFDNYFKGRTFSKDENDKIIGEIKKIKSERTIAAGHDNEKEATQFLDFVNQQMFLTRPDNFKNEWKYGEFLPRFNGSRVEIGPFFKYYNREPDFIYGGYVHYSNEKYCNYKWNRNFNVALNYNWYKKKDWMRAEVDLGWSYFIQLRSQFDFGVKYVPGITLNYFEDIEKLNHAFIPYVGYYSQINETTRINLAFEYRFAGNEELMLSGPEVSVSIYRSRY